MAAPTDSKTIRLRRRSPYRLIALIGMPLICLAFTWVGVRASGAYLAARDMRKVNDAIEHRYLTMRQQNDRIERDVKAFQSPAGVARAARRLGFVKPGEVHLRLP